MTRDGDGRTALITGASAGIGKALAGVFASHGFDLILTARRENRLRALGAEMEQKHQIKTHIFQADLAEPIAPKNLTDAFAAANEIEGFLFGERSQVVVDPAEEKLKSELAGVERSLVPLHTVIRIDAVDRTGSSKVHAVSAKRGKVTSLPTTIYTPGKPKT